MEFLKKAWIQITIVLYIVLVYAIYWIFFTSSIKSLWSSF